MANKFISILDDIGAAFKDIFKVAVPIAADAEPLIAVAFPGASVLYNLTVSLVSAAEAAASAAGASSAGVQKLALVLAALQPYAVQEAAALGIAPPTIAQTTAYVNSIVAGLNAFAAANPTAPATSTSTVDASVVTTTEAK